MVVVEILREVTSWLWRTRVEDWEPRKFERTPAPALSDPIIVFVTGPPGVGPCLSSREAHTHIAVTVTKHSAGKRV